MPVLLRHPATVPALFSSDVEAPSGPPRPSGALWRIGRGAPLAFGAIWIAAVLAEAPFAEAAAAVALALRP